MKLIIGTRGSALALWQARYVAKTIETHHSDVQVELLIIKTRGDKILDVPLATIGGKGLFTKEIEDALLDGRIDLAVHSLKDLPTELPDGLCLAAVMKREDPRDVFISRDGRPVEALESGAPIGTSSLRRGAFLMNRYPKLARRLHQRKRGHAYQEDRNRESRGCSACRCGRAKDGAFRSGNRILRA